MTSVINVTITITITITILHRRAGGVGGEGKGKGREEWNEGRVQRILIGATYSNPPFLDSASSHEGGGGGGVVAGGLARRSGQSSLGWVCPPACHLPLHPHAPPPTPSSPCQQPSTPSTLGVGGGGGLVGVPFPLNTFENIQGARDGGGRGIRWMETVLS
ncbi:hypothetical protein IE53DRAFT_277246 [Violaceomyces palustris]|uniref:Uncharacterized protein n=1 Tax=Violaceomyces palustris TaxID=1673888 RepID=A0ACD0NML3_9BASI|nr:hypothetical protein IE53DRAFT_277246 [Violaceomyces palustris]